MGAPVRRLRCRCARRRSLRRGYAQHQADGGVLQDVAQHRGHRLARQADRVGEAGSKVVCGDFKAPPKKAAGEIIEDEDTNETVEKIVAWLDERKLLA